jgi:hypothetical protein
MQVMVLKKKIRKKKKNYIYINVYKKKKKKCVLKKKEKKVKGLKYERPLDLEVWCGCTTNGLISLHGCWLA